MSNNLK